MLDEGFITVGKQTHLTMKFSPALLDLNYQRAIHLARGVPALLRGQYHQRLNVPANGYEAGRTRLLDFLEAN
jgi:hypothetical protein